MRANAPHVTTASGHGVPQLRLFLVIGSLQAGGAERQMAQMANYWSQHGSDVTLATWSGANVQDFYTLDSGVRRVYLNVEAAQGSPLGRVRFNLRRIRRLRNLLAAQGPDAVLSFIAESNVLTILAGMCLRMRVVVSERSQPAKDVSVSAPWRVLRQLTYRWSDEVVVQTRDAAEWVRRRCYRGAAIIPNILRSLPEPGVSREPLIVAIGRLSPEKGFDLLLSAFARIASEFTEWHVTIVGDGPERGSLQTLRDSLHLGQRVEFAGQVRDVETWMARAGLVVQPSRFEGFPNVVLESMGMGAAVVSSDCQSGPAELIEDGVNGRLVPVENVPALAAAMTELMARPDVRARLGREALKVRRRYQPNEIMELWERTLLPKRPTAQSLGAAQR